MLTYYLKIAFRHFWLQKKYTLLNILGLALGMSLVILISMLVIHELSFDNFHKNKDEIFRVCTKYKGSGEIHANTMLPSAEIIRKEFPEVKSAVSFWGCIQNIQTPDKQMFDCNGYSVEPEVFSMFDFEVLSGDPQRIFEDPYSVMITESFSKRLFGSTDITDKTFTSRGMEFMVKGIIKDVPSNSIFTFDLLLSHKLRYIAFPDWENRWWHGGVRTFLMFHKPESAEHFNDRLSIIYDKYFQDYLKDYLYLHIIPFKGSHLAKLSGEQGVSTAYLWILSGIALAVLSIACINFINLALSQNIRRSKETGMRKVVGVQRSQLVTQFLFETLFYTFIALIIALIIVELLRPSFNLLTGKEISLNYNNYQLILGLLGFGIMTGILSGIYPGLYLSKLSPLSVIGLKTKTHYGKTFFRRGVIIIQFIISIILIFSELIIIRQISFMKNYDVGYNYKNLVVADIMNIDDNHVKRNEKTIRYITNIQKSSSGSIKNATITENIPGFYYQNAFKIFPDNYKNGESIQITSTAVDENFLEVYDLSMSEGRFFSNDFSDDKNAFIINETAMKAFGWNSESDKWIRLDYEGKKYPVIGVMKDFHTNSLQYEKEPMLYRFGLHNNYPQYVTFRLGNNDIQPALEVLKKEWELLFPEVPYYSFFVEDKYNEKYGNEEKLAKIVGSFSILAILLTCLGLFALISFISETRTKEIGIRKASGAKVLNIILLLNTDFVKWVSVAFLFACPIAYYIMNKWLQNFAYKTELSWWIFALAGLIALAIALFTVSWQSWRAARRNPVDSLRYE